MKDNKKTVLCLPFMQITSGHHHVAQTLINELNGLSHRPTCYSIDVLSYSFGHLEKVVSSAYLAWIKWLPRVYDWIYQRAAYNQTSRNNRYKLYEMMFIPFLKQLFQRKKPQIVFCTHALPSYVTSVLKQKNRLNALTVNVYTDFFVNRLWGIEGIDYHFVPTIAVKKDLMKRGVSEKRIFITGIPIDHQLNEPSSEPNNKQHKILIAGGSLGVGALRDIIWTVKKRRQIHYYVLCGKNKRLYNELIKSRLPHVTPFPYITCRKKMNTLYNKVDGVLTKPGGVTLSECLLKRKPTFIYHPLPGQEKINVQQLTHLGLVIPIETKEKCVEQHMMHFFTNQKAQEELHKRFDAYHQHLETKRLGHLLEKLLELAPNS